MSNKNKNLTETLSFTHIYSLKRFSEISWGVWKKKFWTHLKFDSKLEGTLMVL